MIVDDRRPLTARERQILEAIRQSLALRGFQPSIRELGAAVGLRSPSSVHAHLRSLERKGRLRLDGRPRAITSTSVPSEAMTADAVLSEHRRRFTVDEYERMGETGILGPDERVELLDGQIVEMSPIEAPHAAVVNRLTRLLIQRLKDDAVVTVQNPVRIYPLSEPQPDFVVAKPRDDFYASGHPEPDDVLLAVEVSDTSLAVDRGIKVRLYARAGMPEYWIVDVRRRRILVQRDPAGESYTTVSEVGAGATIASNAFPGMELQVKDILGPE